MKHDLFYNNYRIRGESFQPTQSSGWIPRYVLQAENGAADPSPVSHDRLDKVCASQTEADAFAVQDAKNWLDDQRSPAHDNAVPATMTGGLYVVNKPTS